MTTRPQRGDTFQYVFIPADTAYPIEARSFDQVELEDDVFIKMIKKYFATANPESGVDRELLLKQMSEHSKKDISSSIDSETLDRLMSTTSVDIMSIAVPSGENGHIGVSLYCDDKGKSKKLALNERASGLGAACGLVGQTFNGDVFLSRMYDDGEDHWYRLDFTMADVSSDAAWVRRAAEQASRKINGSPASLSGLAEQFTSKTGQSPAVLTADSFGSEPKTSSGGTENYKWYQTAEEIEVTISTDPLVSKSQISVDVKPKSLRVKIADSLVVEGDLFDAADTSESTWTFSTKDRLLQITITKKNSGKMWTDLLKQ